MTTTEYALLDRYARDVLYNRAYDTEANQQNNPLYAFALASFLDRSRWTKSAKNKQGKAFQTVTGFVSLYSPNAFASLFPEIGNPALENNPRPINDITPGLWLIDHTKSGGRVSQHHSQTLTPKCNTRYAMANYLSVLMARYVWFHELSHAYNGHVDYVHKTNIALGLCEVGDASHLVTNVKTSSINNKNEQRILHALEFDADQSAFWASLRLQTDDLENIEALRGHEKSFRIKLALFASYAATWLFEEFQAYMDANTEATHPKPLLRLQNLFRTAAHYVSEHVPELESLNKQTLEALFSLRDTIPKIYHPNAIQDQTKSPSIMTVFEEHDALMAKLTPELEALRFYQNEI